MTTDTKLAPTDAEIAALYAEQTGFILDDSPAALLDFARAVLARWGWPARNGEPDYLDRLIDRLIMPPHSMAASDLRALHDEAAAMLYLGRSVKRAAPKPVEREPAQWQKRHQLRTNGEWENTNEHDAKWWRDNSQGWEIRALYTTPQPTQLQAGAVTLTHMDTKRLAWMADGWTPGHEALYVQHVLSTGGTGSLNDLRTFIDQRIALEAAHGIKGGQHADT